MTVYSFAQLEGLWENAGGPSSVAPIAAAIALAESGGNDQAMNYSDNGGTQTSVSLWQVSNGTHSFPAAWKTPAGNAAEAVAKYRGAGNSFTPWGTYDSGAYKSHLGSATADKNVPSGGAAASSSGSTGGSAAAAPTASQGGGTSADEGCLVGFPGIIGGIGSFCILKKSWARAIMGGSLIVLGGAVTLIGAIQLIKVATGGGLLPPAAAKAPEVKPPAAAPSAAAPKVSAKPPVATAPPKPTAQQAVAAHRAKLAGTGNAGAKGMTLGQALKIAPEAAVLA